MARHTRQASRNWTKCKTRDYFKGSQESRAIVSDRYPVDIIHWPDDLELRIGFWHSLDE